MKVGFRQWLPVSAAITVFGLAGCATSDGGSTGSASGGQVPSAQSNDQGDVSALVDAAKKEGAVVWYTDQPPATDDATVAAFKQAYSGIEVQYVALNSVPIQQRYSSEADSGVFAADVLTLGNSDSFFQDAIGKGWGMKLTQANLPVLKLGTFPKDFMQGDATATVGVSPFHILYNKANISDADAPKTLEDLTDPKYKGKAILADPSASDALLAFYIVIQEKYGNEWFTKIRANQPKFYPTVSGAGQAMVAGEGEFVTPALKAVGAALQKSGAPVGTVLPTVTTGPQFNLMMTTTAKSPHPNAAKLFANFLLSKSGSIAAQGGVGVSPYQSDVLPSGFVKMPAATPQKKAEIRALLGLG